MADLCSILLNALQRQSAGEASAADEIRRVSELMCGERVYRDPVLTSQQVRGIELLLDEWRGMFSFHPGRREGLAPLASLLSLICRKPQVEQLEIYETEEWKDIVGLRGPVETVLICKCGTCRTKYPRMGTSGFLEIIDLLCSACGGIHFESCYDPPKEITCPCGGKAKVGCPSCGSIDGTTVEEMNPYHYFADHALYRHDS
jgi:hypothetical protein